MNGTQIASILTAVDVPSQVEVSEALGGRTAWFSAPHPDKGGQNEDAASILGERDSGLLAVADGAGGQPGGDQASRTALAGFTQAVGESLRDGRDLRDGILDGFERANQAVIGLGIGAATTLSVVAIEGPLLRPFHVGDSEILLVGQRGRVKLDVVSHSPVGYAQAAGMLTEKEALHHEARHVVSNLLGYSDMHIQVGPPIKMALRDTLLLATDGLFDNCGSAEIVRIVRKGPLAKAAVTLAELAQKRMGESRADHPCKPDDVTFLLFRRL